MSKRGRGQRAELSTRAVVIGVICAVLLAVGSWAIDTYGGEGFLPDWSRLYDSLGLETAAPVSQTPQEGQATVTFWDVGQGDSVLISSGGAYFVGKGGKILPLYEEGDAIATAPADIQTQVEEQAAIAYADTPGSLEGGTEVIDHSFFYFLSLNGEK